jgi:tetrahydromethanopterin S-methyltransferase subunit A
MKEKLIKDLENIKKNIEQGVAQLNALYGQEAYITNFLKELDNEEKKEENVLEPVN